LKKYVFSIAAQDDLWYEFTQQGHKDKTLNESLDVKTIMDTWTVWKWTVKKGYPLVTVTKRQNDSLSMK
jgi:hypothetical protein